MNLRKLLGLPYLEFKSDLEFPVYHVIDEKGKEIFSIALWNKTIELRDKKWKVR